MWIETAYSAVGFPFLLRLSFYNDLESLKTNFIVLGSVVQTFLGLWHKKLKIKFVLVKHNYEDLT